MAQPEFCVDERQLAEELPDRPHDWSQVIDKWLLSAESIQNSDLPSSLTPIVWITSEFWTLNIGGLITITDVLFSDNCYSLIRDEVLRLQIVWDRSHKFDPADCPDIDLALVCGHGAAKCISLEHGGLVSRRDRNTIEHIPGWEPTRHVLISSRDDLSAHYRSWVVSRQAGEDEFYCLSKDCFPNIYLHRDINFGRFSQSYSEVLPLVVKHLSFLNDHLQILFNKHKGQAHLIQNEASAEFGIEISPESPLTHNNEAAMRERDVDILEKTLRCEWHSKFFWNSGRIHFHPGLNLPPEIAKETGGKVVVGIFADHLTT